MAIDIAAEHARLLACLRQMADDRATMGYDPVSIYDSSVPDRPPVDSARRVKPYIVLWGDIGRDVPYGERSVTHAGTTDVDWQPQLTLAAGLPTWVLGLVPLARDTIAAFNTSSQAYLMEEDGGPRRPTKDPDESDTPRYYSVLPLRTFLSS